jgi:uncharacterized protein
MRNIWWVAIFFLILSGFLFPLIILADRYQFEIELWHQILMIVAATVICQALSRNPLYDLLGKIDKTWFFQLGIGIIAGAVLMIVPAILLFATGAIRWQVNNSLLSELAPATLIIVCAVMAEEFLFRGFIFQRLIKGFGRWPAQLVIGVLFLLTHLNNPGMTGTIKLLASINIFVASLLFGLAYLRTNNLAMPLGIHFMANYTQGIILGFGVSGQKEPSLFKPIFLTDTAWLTGGEFGLEASAPGLICVTLTCGLLYRFHSIFSLNDGNRLKSTVN